MGVGARWGVVGGVRKAPEGVFRGRGSEAGERRTDWKHADDRENVGGGEGVKWGASTELSECEGGCGETRGNRYVRQHGQRDRN